MTGISEVTGSSYAIAVTVYRPFDDTLTATRDALAAQGFGVLTEIDMQATLKAKLGVDIGPPGDPRGLPAAAGSCCAAGRTVDRAVAALQRRGPRGRR